MIKSKIISVPKEITIQDLKKIPNTKILIAFPYCLKSNSCEKGKKSQDCNLKCKRCKVSSLIKMIEKKRFQYYCVISDDELIAYLHQNNHYQGLVGIACDITIEKIADFIHSYFGLIGFSITLLGDTCKSENDYHKNISTGVKDSQTDINLNQIEDFLNKIS